MRRRSSGRRRGFARVAHSLWPDGETAPPRRSSSPPPSGAAAGRTTLCLGVFDHLHRAPKLISLHAYDADKMIMKLANQAVCNWPSRNSGDGRSAAIVLSKYEMACLNDLTVKSTQLKFAACNECAAFVDRGGNLWRQRQTWKGWKRLTLQRLASGFIKPSWAFHFSASRRP